MKWATRTDVHFTRGACAWLIRRYLDPEAEFVCFDPAVIIAEAAKVGAKTFHARGEGDYPVTTERSSITQFMDRHELWGRDPELDRIARLVGRDAPGAAPPPEKAVLKGVADGYWRFNTDDAQRLEWMIGLWDAVHAWYRKERET